MEVINSGISNIRIDDKGRLVLPGGRVLDKAEMIAARLPKERRPPKKNPRWKDGEFLNQQQAADEKYQTEMKIA